jgi:hypothetical protein
MIHQQILQKDLYLVVELEQQNKDKYLVINLLQVQDIINHKVQQKEDHQVIKLDKNKDN